MAILRWIVEFIWQLLLVCGSTEIRQAQQCREEIRAVGKPDDEHKRSNQWPTARKHHLEKHPTCAACGGDKDLNVHHIKPFHEHPELELDPDNLITLCEAPGRNCHFRFGHCLVSWKTWNVHVVADCKRSLALMEEGRKLLEKESFVSDIYHLEPKDKPWGRNCGVHYGHGAEVDVARIKEGGYSSIHHHTMKYNDFFIVEGVLLVEFFDRPEGEVTKTCRLEANDKLVVEPRVWHRFVAETDVVLVETYWYADISPSDIVRHDTGGLRQRVSER